MNNNFPIFTIHGNFEIYIENFTKINEFSETMIALTADKFRILVQGSQMVIEYMNSDDIKITGIIKDFKISGVVS